jgi:hypothetical protein
MPVPSFLLSPGTDSLLCKLIRGETKVLSKMGLKTPEASQFVSSNEVIQLAECFGRKIE